MHTTHTASVTATSPAVQATGLQTPRHARLSSLALAAVLTVAMLAGVNLLAVGDSATAPQWAQTSTPRA